MHPLLLQWDHGITHYRHLCNLHLATKDGTLAIMCICLSEQNRNLKATMPYKPGMIWWSLFHPHWDPCCMQLVIDLEP